MDVFTREVYPSLLRYLKVCSRGNDDLLSKALSIGWYLWSRRTKEYGLHVFARTAWLYVKSGRDLPGVRARTTNVDAMHSAKTGWQYWAERSRQMRPDMQASLNEEVARLYGVALTKGERVMLDMLRESFTQEEIAVNLKVSPCTIREWKLRIRKRLS